MKLLGRSYSNIKKIALSDNILNSHNLRGCKTIDIIGTNLMLITVTA